MPFVPAIANGQKFRRCETWLDWNVRLEISDFGFDDRLRSNPKSQVPDPKSAQIVSPLSRATSYTSLSPRPERQTTTTSSGFLFPAVLSTCATACELSRAGRIPSSLASLSKAASASASLTGVYVTRPESFQ